MYKQTLCRFGSIHDAQFVDEVRGTGILLDDEERVADVHAGGALRRGAEGDVARQAFVVAVEGGADELAAGVEHGAAGVAAGVVRVHDEAHGHPSVLEGIASEVLRLPELLQAVGHHELPVRRVFLLHHAVQRRLVVVHRSVGRFVGGHLAVGQSQGGVGVGIDGLSVGLAQVHHALDPRLVGGVVVAVGVHHGDGRLQQAVGDGVLEEHHPVAGHFVELGLADELVEVLAAAEDGVLEAGVDEGVRITLEAAVDDLEDADALVGGDVLGIRAQHLLAHELLHFRIGDRGEILVGCLAQTVRGGLDGCLVLALEGGDEGGGAGDAHEVECRDQCLLDGLLVVEGGAALLHDGADAVEGGLVGRVAQLASALQQGFLLGTLGVEHVEAYEAFVHADGVLPIVGAGGVLAGVVDAHGVIAQHLLHEDALAGVAHVMAHEVGRLHPLLHLVGYHVAPVAAGEAHDEGEVALLVAAEADVEVLLHAQGHVVRAVGGGASVLVGVDAEDGEVARVAGPHPVVRVGTELSDARRRRAHHADVAVLGLHEEVVAVAAVEGFQFGFAACAEGDVLVFQEAFAHLSQVLGREVVGALRVGVLGQLLLYVVRHVEDAVDEGHGEPPARQLLPPAHGPEAVRQVVVLHARVLLDGAVAAVVVGEHQPFGRDDLARAASAEVDDGVLQGDAFGVVDGVGGQQQAQFLHGRFVLPLQVGQHPHAFVGQGVRQGGTEEEGKE